MAGWNAVMNAARAINSPRRGRHKIAQRLGAGKAVESKAECLGHSTNRRNMRMCRPRGTRVRLNAYPAMNRWAILCRPAERDWGVAVRAFCHRPRARKSFPSESSSIVPEVCEAGNNVVSRKTKGTANSRCLVETNDGLTRPELCSAPLRESRRLSLLRRGWRAEQCPVAPG